MKTLIELFELCNNRKDYTTVKIEKKKFKKYEVDYKFIEENDVLYIFFEPSDGRTDWIINFSYWRKPYDDMEIGYRVHGGFLESWKLIKDVVRAKVTEKDMSQEEKIERADRRYKWNKVVIVGYSHGGALAALCHECVWFEREDLRQGEGLVGISFDGPRVFAGLYIPATLKERWRNFYVFRNYNDIVTHLPPVLFFFRHVGKKITIGADKNPGLVGAHYPDKIITSLKSFEENGAPGLDERILSMIEGAKHIYETLDADGDRKLELEDVREKFEEIVEKIKEK